MRKQNDYPVYPVNPVYFLKIFDQNSRLYKILFLVTIVPPMSSDHGV
jgi:hypothetical protein